jgi:hypothetical protein
MMKYLIPPAASIARRCLYALTAFLCTAPLVSQAAYLAGNPPPMAAAPFAGTWVNVDENTRDITRIEIAQNGTTLRVHAWGRCHPADCDWNSQYGAIIGSTGHVDWDQSFVLRKMTLSLRGPDRMVAVTESVYKDSRAPGRQIDLLERH